MKCRPQAIDISTRGRLRFAVLFRSRVARRTERHSISRLTGREATRYTKIDQVELSCGCAHDIGRLEITKNNRRLPLVQVVKYRAELERHLKHFL
jgi:hypothetical protein